MNDSKNKPFSRTFYMTQTLFSENLRAFGTPASLSVEGSEPALRLQPVVFSEAWIRVFQQHLTEAAV